MLFELTFFLLVTVSIVIVAVVTMAYAAETYDNSPTFRRLVDRLARRLERHP